MHCSWKRFHCSFSYPQSIFGLILTHWGRVTHIYIYIYSKLTMIGSDNGLLPGCCQAIIRTNTGILLIGHLRINFNEIFIEINISSCRKMHLKMLSAKWCLFRLGLNELINWRPCLTDAMLLYFCCFILFCKKSSEWVFFFNLATSCFQRRWVIMTPRITLPAMCRSLKCCQNKRRNKRRRSLKYTRHCRKFSDILLLIMYSYASICAEIFY